MRRPSKYRNKKVTTEEGTFDSIKEYRRWCELKLLEKAGEISGLQKQVRFQFKLPSGGFLTYPSGRKIAYIADFVYTENGAAVVEDCKGMKTGVYKLKEALMLHLNGIAIRVT